MAGFVVTIAQGKGGAGKTTLAANLAAAWAEIGHTVALVDTDPQRSLTLWGEARTATATGRAALPVSETQGYRARAEIERLARNHDFVVVDSAPHAETEARIVIRAAHLVVVPIQPSPMDVWATRSTLAVAAEEKTAVLLVPNRLPPRARLADAMQAAIAALGAPVAAATLGNRIGLAAAMLEGHGVVETEPRGRAAEEIRALAAEIAARLG